MTIRETVRDLLRANDRPNYWAPDHKDRDLNQQITDVFKAMRWQTSCCWGFGWLLSIVNFWRRRAVTQVITEETFAFKFEKNLGNLFPEALSKAFANNGSKRTEREQDIPYGKILSQQMKTSDQLADNPSLKRLKVVTGNGQRPFYCKNPQTVLSFMAKDPKKTAADEAILQLYRQLTRAEMTTPVATALLDIFQQLNDQPQDLFDAAPYQIRDISIELTVSPDNSVDHRGWRADYTITTPVFCRNTLSGHITTHLQYEISNTGSGFAIGSPLLSEGLPTFTPA